MNIPTITNMLFPRTEEGSKNLKAVSEAYKREYPFINIAIEKNNEYIFLILTYNSVIEVKDIEHE